LLSGWGLVGGGAAGAPDRRPLETSRLGVFAIGDARSGSIKRVAAAVGEGAQVVSALHAFLAARPDARDEAASRDVAWQTSPGQVQPSL
jgi:thioredoxin reductase (NADPH)